MTTTRKSALDQVKEASRNNTGNPNTNSYVSKIPKEQKKSKYYKPNANEEFIRLIPYPDGDVFKLVKYHKAKINGQFREVLCLNNKELDEASCPFCEKADEIRKQIPHKDFKNLTEEQKKENKPFLDELYAHEPITYAIFKLYDRLAPKDGVKFWKVRVNKNSDEGTTIGMLSDIMESYYKETGYEIFDLIKGADIKLNTKLKTLPLDKDKKYREIALISRDKQCEMNADPNDYELLWTDLERKSTAPDTSAYEYLDLAIQGLAPYWIESERKWVFPADSKQNEPSTKVSTVISKTSDITDDMIDDVLSTPQVETKPNNDLPF